MATGVALTVTLDASVLQEHLTRLSTLSLEHIKTDIGEYMLGQVQDRFDGQRLFDDSQMPQSKAAKERSGMTLIDRRLLYKSYVYEKTADGVVVGSDSPYARIHHFGGETGRTGARFEMTARPVIGENSRDDDMIGEIILDELRGLS